MHMNQDQKGFPCCGARWAFVHPLFCDAHNAFFLSSDGGVPPGCGTVLADGDLPSASVCHILRHDLCCVPEHRVAA
eukprot:1146914-Pelagomonas_calceolata.AAC.31